MDERSIEISGNTEVCSSSRAQWHFSRGKHLSQGSLVLYCQVWSSSKILLQTELFLLPSCHCVCLIFTSCCWYNVVASRIYFYSDQHHESQPRKIMLIEFMTNLFDLRLIGAMLYLSCKLSQSASWFVYVHDRNRQRKRGRVRERTCEIYTIYSKGWHI